MKRPFLRLPLDWLLIVGGSALCATYFILGDKPKTAAIALALGAALWLGWLEAVHEPRRRGENFWVWFEWRQLEASSLVILAVTSPLLRLALHGPVRPTLNAILVALALAVLAAAAVSGLLRIWRLNADAPPGVRPALALLAAAGLAAAALWPLPPAPAVGPRLAPPSSGPVPKAPDCRTHGPEDCPPPCFYGPSCPTCRDVPRCHEPESPVPGDSTRLIRR